MCLGFVHIQKIGLMKFHIIEQKLFERCGLKWRLRLKKPLYLANFEDTSKNNKKKEEEEKNETLKNTKKHQQIKQTMQ